jgi:hypothetical protein
VARQARAAALAAAFMVAPAAAQQFVTDDAAITEYGACQLEAWHGPRASWIQPACTPLRSLEVTVAVGFLDAGGADRDVNLLLQAKTLFRELQPGGWAWGLVAGTNPRAQTAPGQRRFGTVFAYVPLSVSFGDDRLVLHQNVGWHYRRDDPGATGNEPAHAFSWGTRGDVWVGGRFTTIGELFGDSRGAHPQWQAGLRTEVVRERLLLDVSYGGHTAAGLQGVGLVVGIAVTPPPFFARRREQSQERSR